MRNRTFPSSSDGANLRRRPDIDYMACVRPFHMGVVADQVICSEYSCQAKLKRFVRVIDNDFGIFSTRSWQAQISKLN